MRTFKTYISFVVQKGEQHVHDSVVADLALPKYSFYLDNTSQQVLQWAEEQQKQLPHNEKLVVLNFFNVSDVR